MSNRPEQVEESLKSLTEVKTRFPHSKLAWDIHVLLEYLKSLEAERSE